MIEKVMLIVGGKERKCSFKIDSGVKKGWMKLLQHSSSYEKFPNRQVESISGALNSGVRLINAR